ncbi:spore coat associated protein CotJA [Fusibacillus kribbianus]|uniref:Spore coat associated protein CotJA n=1 Tax=Fusibacillus kribbianus TaxID=3044208 RepID=A0AAP4EYF6_9FIRM|nr:spore coat associated protein CotJA [Ruminococcus sp. YH-rum2234]MDI9242877.1 spore coat associated protein CotJA [Ruminococcus sp. YH-rum2234]
MERYNQRRADCRRGGSMPGFCPGPAQVSCDPAPRSCPKPTLYESSRCSGSSSLEGSHCRAPVSRENSCGCPSAPRADFNVCRSGQCPSDSNRDVAMGYVPWQQWECTYPLDKGLFIGTVFPSLDKPFVIGRCAVRP